MIQSLKIVNFQSHKDTQLDFHPGVNVIVGASDCGKTAIIRALRWLIWNRPGGEAFRSTWGGDTKVDIELDNVRIIRGKDKENWYGLFKRNKNEPILDETRLKAFGAGVPEPIQEILNMDETNIQQQLDSPFLISNSPGEVSAYFNRIANLEQIDAGLKSTQQNIRSLTNKKQSDESRIEELQIELKQYEYLDKFEIDLEILEQAQAKLTSLYNSRWALETVLTEINHTNVEIDEVSTLPQHEEQVDSLLELHKKLKVALSDFKEVMDLTSTITVLHKDMAEIERKTALESDVDKILRMIIKRDYMLIEIEALSHLTEQIGDCENAEETIGLELRDLEETFHKEMPEICPLCETKLS
jgi:exonuclease SbcC